MSDNDKAAPSSINYTELAEGVDVMREILRAQVAGLMADGYSETQARWITVGLMTSHIKSIDSYGDGADT